ncbi:unnamed protein product [Cylicostephanus goldi]|uniref:Uncharacterized protein n=1 Tax=Cylicostephanus goldi TaxID=71465 RepID=A0A3P6QNY1_CYLGO|nr:unnamed protein product [Cylicostephanus goldi]
MSSFESFLESDSFFSIDLTTKEDEKVWEAFYIKRQKKTDKEKEAYVNTWLKTNEDVWKASTLRTHHLNHKRERNPETNPLRKKMLESLNSDTSTTAINKSGDTANSSPKSVTTTKKSTRGRKRKAND